MAQRSLVTFLAAFGGILIILGGIVGFLLRFAADSPYGPRYAGIDFAVLAVLSIVFGVVILVFSGYTHVQGHEQNLTGGVILMVLGLITWAIAGAWLLVAIGSLLTVVAGLLLVVLVALRDPRIQTHST
jgi:hypothetical protein